ncbi:30596_t:CDS:2 [Gigaspora margarita]|uniref:30596_t:CDS:1 n=1 Tax=Gigaspora margarita TaxID=4874 RepID=A0ABN7WRC6_GIGMA|nr:30596_t:CDS:2 [Gigaspora margarita]
MACLGKKTKAEKRELEVDGVNVLFKFLYDYEKLQTMRKEMVAKDIRLNSFFNSIYNPTLPDKKSDKYLDKLDKRLAVECYIICSNQNSKLTAFKEDTSLFLDLMDLFAKALDALSHTAIPQITLNNASIHNPKLIDFELICNTLGHFYMERMAKTFNDQFYYETSLDKKLENLLPHNYDARITKRREELKMKDMILLDFYELKLEDVASYISALQHVYENPSLNNY